MKNSFSHVLVLEDDPDDFILVKKALKEVSDSLDLVIAERLEDALNLMKERQFDLILSDLSLPDSQGLQTVEKILEQTKTIPVVVLTGLKDEDTGLGAIKLGAQDYLNKEEISRDILRRVIRYAIERKKILCELEDTKQDLIRSNKDLEQFAYVASHDLQEPLRMVSSFTQLLAKHYGGQLDEKAAEYINYAVDGSKKMQKLIEDLLKFSRIGQVTHDLEEVDLNDVLDEILKDFSLLMSETKTKVTCEQMPTITANRSQMRHLFQNFISNAIKFRDKDPVVTITSKESDDDWSFEVRDNGIGIERKYLERIFVIFQRLHSREEYKGTGIGLAVCKKIVENYGGQISVESEVGKGTTFTFNLKKR